MKLDGIVKGFESLTPRGLLALSGLAGVLAFGFFYLVLSNIMTEDKDRDRPDMTMVQVVAAKTEIPLRGEIREEMLRLMEVPQAIVPEDAIKDMKDVVGKPAKSPIYNGDILTGRKVYADWKAAGFPGIIPSNCRAVSLAIDDATGVAGFALPGDYVDVMLVSDKLQDGKVTGEVLLQNALLLSINKFADSNSITGGGDGKNKEENAASGGQIKAVDSPATATLAVPPEDVARLTVASQVGKLYLALRPYQPSTPYSVNMEYTVQLNQGKQNAPQSAPPAPVTAAPAKPAYTPPVPTARPAVRPAKPKEPAIEVIRGTESSK